MNSDEFKKALNKFNLNESYTQSDLKKSYRQLIMANHPDKFIDPIEKANAEERAKEINAAYELLQKNLSNSPYRTYTSKSNNTTKTKSTSYNSDYERTIALISLLKSKIFIEINFINKIPSSDKIFYIFQNAMTYGLQRMLFKLEERKLYGPFDIDSINKCYNDFIHQYSILINSYLTNFGTLTGIYIQPKKFNSMMDCRKYLLELINKEVDTTIDVYINQSIHYQIVKRNKNHFDYLSSQLLAGYLTIDELRLSIKMTIDEELIDFEKRKKIYEYFKDDINVYSRLDLYDRNSFWQVYNNLGFIKKLKVKLFSEQKNKIK